MCYTAVAQTYKDKMNNFHFADEEFVSKITAWTQSLCLSPSKPLLKFKSKWFLNPFHSVVSSLTVTTPPDLPGTVLVCLCWPRAIMKSTPFHSQKYYPGFVGELNGPSGHSLKPPCYPLFLACAILTIPFPAMCCSFCLKCPFFPISPGKMMPRAQDPALHCRLWDVFPLF